MAKKILLVDDEEIITKLTRKRLESQGYECDECWDGVQALEKVKKNQYDLVLLDYAMPRMRGTEFCQNVRQDEKMKDLPIVFLTAHSNKSADFFKDEGGTDVIYKPIDEDDLLDKIKQYLGE